MRELDGVKDIDCKGIPFLISWTAKLFRAPYVDLSKVFTIHYPILNMNMVKLLNPKLWFFFFTSLSLELSIKGSNIMFFLIYKASRSLSLTLHTVSVLLLHCEILPHYIKNAPVAYLTLNLNENYGRVWDLAF